MSLIVSDTGFGPDRFTGEAVLPEDLVDHFGNDALVVDLPATGDPALLAPHLGRIAMIRVAFAAFSDGRGFTQAQRLRRMGFSGHLRAKGHVIADQYAMARRSGFDDVEISAELAARQPADQWAFRANWRAHDYQARLRGTAPLAAGASLAAE